MKLVGKDLLLVYFLSTIGLLGSLQGSWNRIDINLNIIKFIAISFINCVNQLLKILGPGI